MIRVGTESVTVLALNRRNMESQELGEVSRKWFEKLSLLQVGAVSIAFTVMTSSMSL